MPTPELTPLPSKSSPGVANVKDGSLIHVALEALDDNPFQPRTSIDSAELEELVNAIAAQGLIQTIAVRPNADGRFVIVAGHRRVAAFRKLLEVAPSEAARKKYATIPALVKLALDDSQLAAQAYMENVSRAGLNLIEEAVALEKMVGAGLAQTTDDLATLVQQPRRRVERLRRLAGAPKTVQDGVANGLMVATGTHEDGKERKELRRLDFTMAMSFLRLFDHLRKTSKKAAAEERTDRAIRRALLNNWSFKRADEYVDQIIAGQQEDDDKPEAPAKALYERTARRFVVDLSRIAEASEGQIDSIKAELLKVLLELRQPAPTLAQGPGRGP